MIPAHRLGTLRPPAFQRLDTLCPLDAGAVAALTLASRHSRTVRARRELLREGQEMPQASLILNGWAARTRLLEDGRRQILQLLLPGDLIGLCDQPCPIAVAAVSAITDLEICTAPNPALSPTLGRAYALARAFEEAHLLAQITRLGRMDAYERIADLLLELLERSEQAGLALRGRYDMPVTQELLADCLGLTPVHINRTLQALRKDEALDIRSREVRIADPAALRRKIGRAPVRIAASCPHTA